MTQEPFAESGNPEPGPDNFDFEAWLDDESTFPVFNHKVFVDQKAGAEYAALDGELEELSQLKINLDAQIENRLKASANSFVDATLDRLHEERDEVEAEIEEAVKGLKELAAQINRTAITMHFQVKTPEELGTVTREATRQFHKENAKFKNANEEDLDYITARSRYMLTAQIAHFCTGMTLHKEDRKVGPPTRQGADKLMTKLVSTEMMRLMEAMGRGLSDSRDWANKIDAGFPGGSPDVEEVSLGEAGLEDRPILGGSSPDHADRQGLDLG